MKYLKENFSDILIGGFGLYALVKVIMGLINGRITLSQRGGGQSTILNLGNAQDSKISQVQSE